jgi:ribosomal 50S subunit-recycling heat shock protein
VRGLGAALAPCFFHYLYGKFKFYKMKMRCEILCFIRRIAMRLDKYLKVSRLIKRRTVANEACDAGRVLVNDKPAKASVNVKTGDVIEIQFGTRSVKVEVVNVQETVRKEEAQEMYKYL